ncbi:MAG: hypothetical protein H0U59_00410 [Gemmatimonadaceae bacterium]|nr:hypothetical protein [Gemmatimonadaceae bacterium]MBA3761801.1 hypothetical protein [Chthoniobacterales bacterium]
MPSTANLSDVFKSLTSITAYRAQPTSPADTTTTAALARDAAVIPVTSATGIVAAEPFFLIGDAGTELNTVASIATTNVTPSRKVVIAQAIGARYLEAVAYSLGHIAEDSAQVGGSSSLNPIPAATSSVPIGYFNLGGALSFGFSLLGVNARSFALAFGQEELETGTGTSADPWQNLAGQTTVGTHSMLCFRALGVLKSGKFIEVDMLDCTTEVAADLNISGKSVRPIPVGGSCTGHIVRIWS